MNGLKDLYFNNLFKKLMGDSRDEFCRLNVSREDYPHCLKGNDTQDFLWVTYDIIVINTL